MIVVNNKKEKEKLLRRLDSQQKQDLEEGKEVTLSDSFGSGWWIISKDGDSLCKRYKINSESLSQKGMTEKKNPIHYQTN